MKKLIFICQGIHPITFQLQSLRRLQQTYSIEFWDVSKLYAEVAPCPPYGLRCKGSAKEIDSLNDLSEQLHNETQADVLIILQMPSVHYGKMLGRIVTAINESSFSYALMDCANSFAPRRDFDELQSAWKRFSRKSPLGFRNRSLWFWSRVSQPVFAVTASRFVEDDNKIRGVKTNFYRSHGRDYEYFLHYRDTGTDNNKKFAVFIDQAYPCDDKLDSVLFNESRGITPNHYYQRVGTFMNRLAIQSGVDNFTIAVHPSNLLSEAVIKECLAGFECDVVKHRTTELVRDCSLVVGLNSSAFGLAVLFGKPICFFDYALPRTIDSDNIAPKMAKLLGRRVNTILDSSIDWGMADRRYRRFRDRYVKEPNSFQGSYFDLFAVLADYFFKGSS